MSYCTRAASSVVSAGTIITMSRSSQEFHLFPSRSLSPLKQEVTEETEANLPVRIFLQPGHDFRPELLADNATEVVRVLDLNDGPVLADLLQGRDIELFDEVILIPDQDGHGNLDRLDLLLRQRQLGEASATDGGGLWIRVLLADPGKAPLSDAAGLQPAHAAERAGPDAVGMLDNEVRGDDAAHGITDDV